MSSGKMHANEVETSVDLVRRLIEAQFPQWADLPITPVRSSGTDNAMYRLGDELAVRMPRIPGTVEQVEKEQRWLPQFAPLLPLAIPTPVARGASGEGYPLQWSVYRWLEGETATLDRIADVHQAARDIAGFVSALRHIDPTGGPLPGPHNFHRGVPLATRDAGVRAALAELDGMGMIDTAAAAAAWERSLQAPEWDGAPVWIHGDLQSGNLLAVGGQIRAVIDFGGMGIGDPACDLMVAWNLLPPDAREVFRTEVGADDATWERGRGWALSVGLIALPYYHITNPVLADVGRVAIEAVVGCGMGDAGCEV